MPGGISRGIPGSSRGGTDTDAARPTDASRMRSSNRTKPIPPNQSAPPTVHARLVSCLRVTRALSLPLSRSMTETYWPSHGTKAMPETTAGAPSAFLVSI